MRYVVILSFLLLPFGAIAQLSIPENLRINFIESSRTVQLIWDSVEEAVGYNLFVRKNTDEEFRLVGRAGMLYDNSFEYQVQSDLGQKLEFAICSIDNYPKVERSELSETIEIEIPSIRLPMVKLNTPKVKNGNVSVSWDYQYDIPDVQSFIIMVNGSPKPVAKDKKELTLNQLPKGNYAIEVQARSKKGITSPPSTRRFVTVK